MISTEVPELDAADDLLLAELQRDGRITMVELGRRVGLSQPAVTERVRKLEMGGFIRGYRAVVDYKRLGYGLRALVGLGRVDYARVVKLIEQTPEVINAFDVTGEESWILEIAVIDVEHLDAVVTRFGLLAPASTSIILSMPREHAVVLPARRENIKPAVRKVSGR
ncbi:Lrp/AsnC family transcriptional regulator [Ramlibacter sp.]|uniref:Lrp/AsnC family transcriptional regulator n=1 Tax=Ramlibacter sp. TaxID=1917967 RepID=UPI003D09C9D3